MRVYFAISCIWAGLCYAAGAAASPPAAADLPKPPAATSDKGFTATSPVSASTPSAEGRTGVGDVTVLSSDETACVFEVQFPALASKVVDGGGKKWTRFRGPLLRAEGKVGTPELLARHVKVAAPPGAVVTATVERVSYDVFTGIKVYPRPADKVVSRHGERTVVEAFAYDAAAYAAATYPEKFATLGDEFTTRGYRLFDVAVYAYQYDGAKQVLKVAKGVVVRVSFAGGVRRPNVSLPAKPEEKGMFARALPAVVLNFDVARRWPFAGAFGPAQNDGVWPNDFADKAAVKIVVKDERLYRLTYEELKRAGFPVETANPKNFRVFTGEAKPIPKNFYEDPPPMHEVPIYVAGEEDGRFDPGDYVDFYGHGADFFEEAPPGYMGTRKFSKHRYTKYNMYWLVADDEPGARMSPKNARPAGGTKPSYFWDRLHMEEDRLDKAEHNTAILENDEFWYWEEYTAPVSPTGLGYGFNAFDVATTAAPTEAYFQLKVRRDPQNTNAPSHTVVYVNTPTPAGKIFEKVYTDEGELTFDEKFPVARLREGRNLVYVEEKKETPYGADIVWVDAYEFEYPRRFRAYQDYLAFANPPEVTGKVLFEVSGFTDAQITVYDVTRGRALKDFEVKEDRGTFTLRFTDDVGTGINRYVAATTAAAGAVKPVDIYLDAPSRLRDFDEDVDDIVVVYDAFKDNIQPLVNWRRSRGRDVIVAEITDIYDEYSWGLFDPTAIRSFIKDLYGGAIQRPHGRLPETVLLVGDAWSNWRDTEGKYADQKIWRSFGLNQVPTYYITTTNDGRAASDNMFVAMNNIRVPDLAVGRLAAPFDENIDAIVAKILDYERRPQEGAWKARFLLVSDNDDENEGGSGWFVMDNETLAENFVPLGFEVRKEYIEWLNRRYPNEPPGSGFDWLSREERKKIVADYMKPNFLKSFDALIVEYAGHGGPQVWSHENLFAHHKDAPPVDDIYKLENGPRYPIIVQLSCSTAYFDYDLQTLSYLPRDYDQCISEYIIQAPGQAGVAALGSTRLSTEGAQKDFMEEFTQYIFPGQRLREEEVTAGEAHWVAKLGSDNIIRDLFVLMGDPAMTVAAPKAGIILTPNKSTVKRGEHIKVAGTVPGNLNGRAVVQIFDQPFYYDSKVTSGPVYRDRLLATAEVEVVNGRFEATLAVPTVPVNPVPSLSGNDVVAAAPAAETSMVSPVPAAVADFGGATPVPSAPDFPVVEPSYEPVAENGVAYVRAVAYGEGSRKIYVCNETVQINVQGEVATGDKEGPDISVWLEDRSFRSGDATSATPKLIVDVRDESGVLVARNVEAIGKEERTYIPLYARIDNQPNVIDLTFYYRPSLNDWRAGSAEKEITLGNGKHTVAVTAADSFGNERTKTVNCVVSDALALWAVMNCPNPFAEETYFTFVSAAALDSVVIKVFTPTGRLVRKMELGALPAGYNQIRWDGRDQRGDPIANGVYFYTITAHAGDQKFVSREKLVKMR